jgi:hypothetical protein
VHELRIGVALVEGDGGRPGAEDDQRGRGGQVQQRAEELVEEVLVEGGAGERAERSEARVGAVLVKWSNGKTGDVRLVVDVEFEDDQVHVRRDVMCLPKVSESITSEI